MSAHSHSLTHSHTHTVMTQKIISISFSRIKFEKRKTVIECSKGEVVSE